MIDPTTSVQYSGYFQKQVRQSYETGKVSPDNEEARVQGILEAERKKIEHVAHARGKRIEHQKLERDVKEKRMEFREFGNIVNILV